MHIRRTRDVALIVLLAGTMASCGGGESDATDTSGTWPDPTSEPAATAPAPERTSHEAPAPGGNGGEPYIDVAGAPIGDDGTDYNDDGTVCQQVTWLGDREGANLGAGISFQVTRVDIVGAAAGGFSCEGPPCQGFTFTDNGDSCGQALRPGPSEGSMAVYGQVRCSAPESACKDFRSRLTRQTISINPAEPTGGGTSPDPGMSPSATE